MVGKLGWRMRRCPWLHWSDHRWCVLNGYTDKFEDALSLVPEGYHGMSISFGERGTASARVEKPYVYGNAKTLPLAICIAALKALSHDKDESHG